MLFRSIQAESVYNSFLNMRDYNTSSDTWKSTLNELKGFVESLKDICEKKDYQQYKDDPRLVRYSFFIDKPSIGKIFILKDQPFHMIPQGDVYKWNKWDEWHLGFNCGLTQKFLFHFIGFDQNVV
mgnify:CR=1 FL=1